MAGWLARERPPGLEVMVLICGLRGVGDGRDGGLDAAPRDARLDPETTLVLGLDTVGSGEPVVLEAEGPLWPVRYREEDVGLAERAAAAAGCRCGAGGWGPGPIRCWPALGGLPALSLLSVRDGGFPNYHLPTDTPENVDFASRGGLRRAAEPPPSALEHAA